MRERPSSRPIMPTTPTFTARPENPMTHARHAMLPPLLLPTLLLASILTTACRGEKATVRGDTTAALQADTARATSLSDPQVATLVSAINTAEVGAANGALPKLGNKLTQAFAQSMAKEHGVMDSTIKAIPAAGAAMPVPPPQVATMLAAAKAEGDLLGGVPAGLTMDRAYIASQVGDHQMALDSLQRWRQSVRDGQLAAAIDAGITRVRAHLAQARSIQSALGSDTTGATPSPALLKKPDVEKPGSALGGTKPDTTVSNAPKKP
jgi:putative membrane protein